MKGKAESVATSGRLVFEQLDPPLAVELREVELFVPGHKKVIERGSDGAVISEREFLGRFFRGTIEGESKSRASMLIAPEGFYGVVERPHQRFSFQPRLDVPQEGGRVLQEVSITQVRTPFAELGAALNPTKTRAENTFTSMTTYDLHIKAWAESAYASYTSDWSNRISAAYNYVASMFLDETSIYLGLYTIENAGENWSGGTCSGVGDSGLAAFTDWVDPGRWDVDGSSNTVYANAYAGFTASTDPGEGVGGCGNSRALTRNVVGGIQSNSTHTVMGKDWHRCNLFTACDSYNPDDTDHLGLVAGHELTHNAGEPEHPGDNNGACDYNLMANGIAYQCVWAWRTSGTISKVNGYAPGRLT